MHLNPLCIDFAFDIALRAHFKFFASDFTRYVAVDLSKSGHIDGAYKSNAVRNGEIVVVIGHTKFFEMVEYDPSYGKLMMQPLESVLTNSKRHACRRLKSSPKIIEMISLNIHITTIKRCLAVAVACLYLSANLACAETMSPQDRPDCPDPIDFGYVAPSQHVAPRQGIDLDIMALLSAHTGCRFQFIELPVERIRLDLASGRIGMSSRWFETPERANTMWFAHYQLTKNLAIYRPSHASPQALLQLVNRPELAVGTVRGFSYGPSIDAVLNQPALKAVQRIVEFADRPSSFEGLRRGHVQVIFLPLEVFEDLRSRLPATESADFATLDLAPSEPAKPGGLVMSKSKFDAEQARRWRLALDQLCREGKVLEVFRRYFPATAKDVTCKNTGKS